MADYEDEHGYGEDRQLAFGFLKGRLVKLVFVECEPDIIRVISLRKATSNERKEFAKALA